ncbi:MAG: 50S ribosome-binding GTPase, partial [Alphaproteobacteria bacterium]|nr:50S ribosome-binding GTPase [Alphaproteobacteria bacterium]
MESPDLIEEARKTFSGPITFLKSAPTLEFLPDMAVNEVAFAGRSNVGKSSLLNALTKSRVHVENKLFATLDPTTRRLRFPREREAIITDTVGFLK